MSEKRIIVWVQNMGDRPYLMLQWHDPVTGARKSKSAQTCNPLDAERLRSDLEYELNNGLHQRAARMSWEHFRELFEAEYVAARRPNTRENYRKVLDLFEALCHPGPLSGITVRTVSTFAAAMRRAAVRGNREGYAPGTVKLYLQFLHTALAWAVSQKLLPECPEFPEASVPEKDPQPVPAESVEKLLAKADPQTRVFLLCGWLAGLRLAEAYRLEWEPTEKAPYLDLARDRIVFPAEFVKGRRDQWVPVEAQLRQALESLPREGERVFRLDGRKGALTLYGMSQRVRCLARRAGVRLTMKSLRRGFACRYAARVPAQVLQKLMRHRNLKITMTYYANVDDAVMDAVLGDRGARRQDAADFSIRNSSRNSGSQAPPAEDRAPDATTLPGAGL